MNHFLFAFFSAAVITGGWGIADYFLDKYLGVRGSNYSNIAMASFLSALIALAVANLYRKVMIKRGV
jgi:hypothetical protein